MRISDWSSDVCSSDLPRRHRVRLVADHRRRRPARRPRPHGRDLPAAAGRAPQSARPHVRKPVVSLTTTLTARAAALVARRTSRRGFIHQTAVVGSALNVAGPTYMPDTNGVRDGKWVAGRVALSGRGTTKK